MTTKKESILHQDKSTLSEKELDLLYKEKSIQLGIALCDEGVDYIPNHSLAKKIPYAFAKKHKTAPVGPRNTDVEIIAIHNPCNLSCIEDLQWMISHPFHLIQAPFYLINE